MACERNRIVELVKYIEACGVTVNVGKNKAFGNRGFFRARGEKYRIDISKDLDECSALRTLVHEFVHFIHFNYDKKLKNLDFVFENYNPSVEEELINLTVDLIPKTSAAPLFELRDRCRNKVEVYYNKLKKVYPEIKKSEPLKSLEKTIKGDLKYLLKYDRVKVFKGFSFKIYEVENIQNDFPDTYESVINYIKFKSAQRKLKRVTSKISRLNRYYNSPTELLARSFELYITNPERMKEKAGDLYFYYNRIVAENKVPMITEMVKTVMD